jgi:hypothetical protein
MVYVQHFGEQLSTGAYAVLASDLIGQKPIHTGEWQAMDTRGSDLHATHELEDVILTWDQVPVNVRETFPFIDFTWAEEHFNERVSGLPLNPAPSHVRWPYAVGGNARHMDGKKFDHTYPERFWPKFPNGHEADPSTWRDPVSDVPVLSPPVIGAEPMRGHYLRYGDLSDVVDLLARSPLTRQAYLPVWFPEDTGAHHGQRVPCTLGYHFMQRGGFLSVRYFLRSCDIYRHISNDVFFTHRLLTWICDEVAKATDDKIRFRPGSMTIFITSLHAFVGDKKKIEDRILSLPDLMAR